LDIRQDSEFATGYGHPKTAFKRKPDTDPDATAAVAKIALRWRSNAFFSFMLLFTLHSTKL